MILSCIIYFLFETQYIALDETVRWTYTDNDQLFTFTYKVFSTRSQSF